MSDPMSDVLRSVRLSGGVFLDVQLTEPFCLISELTAADCRPLLDDPVQLVFYHVVLKGRATMILPGEHPVEVGAGEVAILPHNDTHTVASAPGLSPTIARSLVQPAADGGLARIVYGGGGAETHMFCGFLGSTERRNPVLAMLPRLVTLDLRSAAAREWIESSVRFAAGELAEGRLASSGVMSRLSEVLLVEAVRQFAAGAGPEGQAGSGAGRSPDRARAGGDPPRTRCRLDGRDAGGDRRPVAQRICRPLRRAGGQTAHPLHHALAAAPCPAAPARAPFRHRADRARGRL